mmetsp:Transcript_113334/g.366593  ORF Transcript_113334/g.366593 Transcript_113334/m.366593 type:complete len:431 (+) Transcript_113334:3-1295(+)
MRLLSIENPKSCGLPTAGSPFAIANPPSPSKRLAVAELAAGPVGQRDCADVPQATSRRQGGGGRPVAAAAAALLGARPLEGLVQHFGRGLLRAIRDPLRQVTVLHTCDFGCSLGNSGSGTSREGFCELLLQQLRVVRPQGLQDLGDANETPAPRLGGGAPTPRQHRLEGRACGVSFLRGLLRAQLGAVGIRRSPLSRKTDLLLRHLPLCTESLRAAFSHVLGVPLQVFKLLLRELPTLGRLTLHHCHALLRKVGQHGHFILHRCGVGDRHVLRPLQDPGAVLRLSIQTLLAEIQHLLGPLLCPLDLPLVRALGVLELALQLVDLRHILCLQVGEGHLRALESVHRLLRLLISPVIRQLHELLVARLVHLIDLLRMCGALDREHGLLGIVVAHHLQLHLQALLVDTPGLLLRFLLFGCQPLRLGGTNSLLR